MQKTLRFNPKNSHFTVTIWRADTPDNTHVYGVFTSIESAADFIEDECKGFEHKITRITAIQR